MNDFNAIVKTLKNGGIIAYPTESVFGLGCDPFNESAVMKLLALKKRSMDKGLILIASEWDQVSTLTDHPMMTLETPCTFLYPAIKKAPKWITGNSSKIALRLTQHPIVKKLCDAWGGALVSTSANISTQNPARTYQEIMDQFPTGIDLIVEGELGSLKNPTPIIYPTDIKMRNLNRRMSESYQ